MREPEGDHAVTDIVGSMAMLAVTVLVFAGVSLFVLWEIEAGPAVAHSEFRFEERDGRLVLRHVGGLAVPLAFAQVVVAEGPSQTTLELTGHASLFEDGSSWHLGESVCVVGAAPSCLRATAVDGAAFVLDGTILALHGGLGGSP